MEVDQLSAEPQLATSTGLLDATLPGLLQGPRSAEVLQAPLFNGSQDPFVNPYTGLFAQHGADRGPLLNGPRWGEVLVAPTTNPMANPFSTEQDATRTTSPCHN